MSSKRFAIFGCTVLAFALFGAFGVRAEDAAAEGDGAVEQTDPALKAEVEYVEALIDARLPDFAETVIENTKKKWPESDAMFFALEIRGLLALGKFDEADKKIAALPDRTGAKYWAARLELANNFFARGKRDECAKIYDEFFSKNAKPAKGLVDFARQARYQYGQILMAAGRKEEAARSFDALLAMLNPKVSDEDDNIWCNIACETADIYLVLAAEKGASARGGYLASAKKYIDKLLWRQDLPLYFGRAIAMKAYLELLSGRLQQAQTVMDDYSDQLQEIHTSIEQADPDGRLGLLRQSPVPQCRYMMADKYWTEAQVEFKKGPGKRDDEKIKSLLVGAKNKSGKRAANGAFQNAVNVYLRYPQSNWAPAAGKLQDEIAEFLRENYGAKLKTMATPEQIAHVIQVQFQNATQKFAEGDYEGAIKDYEAALANYPEQLASVQAVENMANSYLFLAQRDKDDEQKAEYWTMCAHAVAGYLSERFAGVNDKKVMSEAGDAVLRLAAKIKQLGGKDEAKKLYVTFLDNYRSHVQAATLAASFGGAAQAEARKMEEGPERNAKLEEALEYYRIVAKNYKKSPFYLTSIAQASACYGDLGDREKSIEFMKMYYDAIDGDRKPLAKMKARMSLAVLYQKDGLEKIKEVEDDPSLPDADERTKAGMGQLIRGIKEFGAFAEEAKKMVESPSVTKQEKDEYLNLREGALYIAGDCYHRLARSLGRMEKYAAKAGPLMEKSAENLEAYVAEFPKGKYAKRSYALLGRIYTQLEDVVKGKEALTRLKREFPESEEARKAMPQLATSMVEYAATLTDAEKKEKVLKQVHDIYREMLDNTKNEYRPIDYVRAGEVLVDAKDWSLAADAFAKAESTAGTNQTTTIALARLGKAKSYIAQKLWFDARETLDEFMEDEKMSKRMIVTNACDMLIQVAMEQGKTEKDASVRRKHFGAAFGAVKKLRGYWSLTNETGEIVVPQWQLDRVDLMSAGISIAQMEGAKHAGDQEEAERRASEAARRLQTFIVAHGPTEEVPIDKMGPKNRENLEKAYADICYALLQMGGEHLGEVIRYGKDYASYFPNGRRREEVSGYVKEAEAKGAKETPAAKPAEDGEAAAEGEGEAPAAEGEEEAPAAEGEEEAPAAEGEEEAPAAEGEGEPAADTAPAAEAETEEEPSDGGEAEVPAVEESADEEPAE